jgi:methionyl-tRNA formyltransferase
VSKGPRRFGHVESVALIGGGDLMHQTAQILRQSGLRTIIVLAPRHAEEFLPVAGGPAKKAFADDGSAVHVVQDINAWQELESADWAGANSLALCFGPPWIFDEHVLARFGAGMINFNGIPIPRYIGGAHYTWQILNGDRTGGCFLQEITMDVDRGPLLRRHLFDLPAGVRLPEDYFLANYEEGCRFMEQAIADMRADKEFEPIEFTSLDESRLYYPRLNTLENGWIDWSWTALEIERFCCAFDRPYAGAATLLGGAMVRLSDVRLTEPIEALHPFVAGLVVRNIGQKASIAARDGLLTVTAARSEDGNDAMELLKEGRRLYTPPDRLSHALTCRPALTANGFLEKKR